MAKDSHEWDSRVEAALEKWVRGSLGLLIRIMKSFWQGLKRLKGWGAWGGLLIASAGAMVGYLCRGRILGWEAPVYIRCPAYWLLLTSPALYLCLLGGLLKKQKNYERYLIEIGFVGKDKKCPHFCGSAWDGKKQILFFKSNIPLAEWKGARARLETALDCNILRMEYGNSKRVVRLTILPADFRIPEMITWDDENCSKRSGTITVGQSALDSITFDLNRVPHVLVAGETGSGKSVILRCILWQMILQGSRVYMIDFKGGVEFGRQYERFGEVITDRERALKVLDMLVEENARRLQIFRNMEVKNLAEYNRKTGQNLCRIGVFSDELAEMLDKKGVSKEQRKLYEELEGKLSTLARLSRATGINLFLGVQRPDATVLTGQIKNNIPVRISGRFADKTASEIVLGNTDAVELPDIKGRFLYKVGNETVEFQSYYFDDEKMLHDVNVEQGSMLTCPEAGGTGRENAGGGSEEDFGEKRCKRTASGGGRRNRFFGSAESQEARESDGSDADAYPDWSASADSEELPFPLDAGEITSVFDFNYEEDDG